jgi:hypothetical protein
MLFRACVARLSTAHAATCVRSATWQPLRAVCVGRATAQGTARRTIMPRGRPCRVGCVRRRSEGYREVDYLPLYFDTQTKQPGKSESRQARLASAHNAAGAASAGSGGTR